MIVSELEALFDPMSCSSFFPDFSASSFDPGASWMIVSELEALFDPMSCSFSPSDF